MRTITIICGLLLLSSCDRSIKTAVPPATRALPERHGPFMPGSSTPIIIADGSITVTHSMAGSHFRIYTPRKAVLKLTDYQPVTLGFGCDPTNATCSAAPGCSAGSLNTTKCTLGVDPTTPTAATTWKLYLCDTNACNSCTAAGAPVTLTWLTTKDGTSDNERIDIDSTIAPTVVDSPGVGPRLKYPTQTLQCATLSVAQGSGTPQNYNFQFSSNTSDLKISYECYFSGNNRCTPQ